MITKSRARFGVSRELEGMLGVAQAKNAADEAEASRGIAELQNSILARLSQ